MNIGIVGSGSWGVALGTVLTNNKHEVLFLCNQEIQKDEINSKHTLEIYAPGIDLGNHVKATSSYKELLAFASTIVIVVPSAAIEDVINKLRSEKIHNATLVIATKGLIHKETINEFIRHKLDVRKNNIKISILSGPSFAKFVLEKKITCVVSASKKMETAKEVAELFFNNYFRVYLSTDVNGVEFCGGFKNVIALGAGMLDGRGEGSNARAALISRGLFEMSKYARIFNVKKDTLYGLTGVGDLVLTATDMTSRNYSLGYYLGKGMPFEEALIKVKTTAESIVTIKELYEISIENKIDSPIIQTIYGVLYVHKSIDECLAILMNRAARNEFSE
jgi:glycerol-3-phosphate dehydrogenase (NAD(P)+)